MQYRDDSQYNINASNPEFFANTPLKNGTSRAVSFTSPRKSQKKRNIIIACVVLAVVAVAVAVALGVTLSKHNSNDTKSSSTGSSSSPSSTPNSTSSGGGSSSKNIATSGTTGSTITAEDNSTFLYTNDFGGDWAADPTQPFASGGKAQSWSKRIGTEEWVWGTDVARGVNLG